MYTIASSFGAIVCHATSSNIEKTSKAYNFHYFCFQYSEHSQSPIEEAYKKDITFLFSPFLIHCL